MRVAFIHPDLGLGGAERLVVDMALGLVELGDTVEILTPHFDPARCFDELKHPHSRLHVHHMAWVAWLLPRELAGSCQAAMAALRCAFIALHLVVREAIKKITGRQGDAVDVVVCDIVTLPILVLATLSRMPTLFYCHYPDKLLTKTLAAAGTPEPPPTVYRAVMTTVRRYYRYAVDWLEEEGIRKATKVVVNSQFTAAAFQEAFQRVGRGSSSQPEVLYPAVSLPAKSRISADRCAQPPMFLSLNRFERKKNIGLAIESFALLRDTQAELVVAGGCDPRLSENMTVLQELCALAQRLGVEPRVRFKTNVTLAERDALLQECICVVYTPSNEHFGIVPLEAMSFGRPVIACDSGGPTETIVDGQTGFLCRPDAVEYARKMRLFVAGRSAGIEEAGVSAAEGCGRRLSLQMGECGRTRVERSFSAQSLAVRTQGIMVSMGGGGDWGG